jgi:hypothetical protein
MPQNGIAHIIKMRDLGIIKNEAIFEFGRIPRHDSIADDDIFADVAAIANLAILTDPSWPLNHGSLLDDGILSNEYGPTDEWFADQTTVETWLETKLEIAGNLREHIPRMLDIFK